MVRRLPVGNFFIKRYIFLIEVSDPLDLIHQEKHHLKFIQSVTVTHISRAIVFRVLVETFPVVALFLFSSIIVWYVSQGNTCRKTKLSIRCDLFCMPKFF